MKSALYVRSLDKRCGPLLLLRHLEVPICQCKWQIVAGLGNCVQLVECQTGICSIIFVTNGFRIKLLLWCFFIPGIITSFFGKYWAPTKKPFWCLDYGLPLIVWGRLWAIERETVYVSVQLWVKVLICAGTHLHVFFFFWNPTLTHANNWNVCMSTYVN